MGDDAEGHLLCLPLKALLFAILKCSAALRLDIELKFMHRVEYSNCIFLLWNYALSW